MIHPAHAMGVFRRNERFEESMDLDRGTRSLVAAAALGVFMAETSQRGFEVFSANAYLPPRNPYRPDDIRAEVLARLCLVANPNRSSFFVAGG